MKEFLRALESRAAADGLRPSPAADLLRRHISRGLEMPSVAESRLRKDRYTQEVLHVADDGRWSVVALMWLPGQATPIHDHVAWCVVGVLAGAELEESFDLVDTDEGPVLALSRRTFMMPGHVSYIEPPREDIHRVSNAGNKLAVSMHVYGADVRANGGTSINTVFDQPIRPSMQSGGSPISWRRHQLQ